ncbi:MAG: MFS transporter [Deltaproteobacteria bacterium]|nr:MFS transporter [Deltaproteobacteria bacterium]
MSSEPDKPSSEPAEPPEPKGSPRRGRPHLWVSTTYFAEGFPYIVVNSDVVKELFWQLGASKGEIGLTALFHLPWNLKFLWGPFVDHYETKRRWLLASEIALSVVMVALAFVVSAQQTLTVISAVFVVMAVLSATHDIAIDGFYLEGLDEQGQSRFVGYRAMAYKLASLLVSGPGMILIGLAGWLAGLMAMAGVMVALLVTHALILPRVESRGHPVTQLLRALLGLRVLAVGAVIATAIAAERQWPVLRPAYRAVANQVGAVPWLARLSVGAWFGMIAIGLLLALLAVLGLRSRIQRRLQGSDSHYAASFLHFLAQPKVGRILAFVVLFRTGESFLQAMKILFLREEMKMTLEQYGTANGTVGMVASIVATIVGGGLIARQGLRRWIWPFVIAQNALNLLYLMLAMAAPDSPPSIWTLTAVITAEHFGAGLGTAVFMVYMMRCCDPEHKAAHMAILTALMSVSFTVAGAVSGFLAEAVGFATYFGLTFIATIPGMVLIFFIPYIDGRKPSTVTPAEAAEH